MADQNDIAGIDAPSLDGWIPQHVDGVTGPFSYELIAGGHSNLTYKVTDAAGADYVLRRPPLGAVLATAHDMGREHKIITGVGKTDVPVPVALGLCEDESVNDAPFYVMSFVEGVVLMDADAVEAQVAHGHHPPSDVYGEGKAGQRIAALLATEPLVIEKRLTYEAE